MGHESVDFSFCNFQFRLKEAREEMETQKNRATAAERTSTAMDAQRKAAVADRAALQKEVRGCGCD